MEEESREETKRKVRGSCGVEITILHSYVEGIMWLIKLMN